MHRLTIHHSDHAVTTSEHPDFTDATRMLARYADHISCQLGPIQLHCEFSSWDLVSLDDDSPCGATTVEHVHSIHDAEFAALKQILDAAITADSGDPLVDAYERAAMDSQWAHLTGARRHVHRAS